MALFDSIATSFDGVQTTFTLSASGEPLSVPTPRDLDISIGGVVQYETTDFSVSGSEITFNNAPLAGDLFRGEFFEITTIIGPDGPQGATGNTGPQGATGAVGVTGQDGATGGQGPQGLQGATGPQGAAGDDGATGCLLYTSPSPRD